MKSLLRIIRANLYKLVHTKQLLLHLLIPILGIVIFCGYYSYSPWGEFSKILAYIQSIAMAFPLAISIVVTMYYEDEMKAGDFQNILSLPCSKTVSHLGNFLSICIFGLLACIFAVFGFGVIFRIMGFVKLDLLVYLKFAFAVFMANLALYILQYITCFTVGKGISIALGILGTILSPLLILGIGEGIWKYIPCGYGIRFSTYYVSSFTDKQAFSNMYKDFNSGITIASIITIALFILLIIWSTNWQGSNERSE